MISSLIRLMSSLWLTSKSRGEIIGLPLIVFGILILISQFALVLSGLTSEIGLLSASLGIISVGLGFIALGVATKSDKRHTELMKELGKAVSLIPTFMKGDILSPSGQVFAEKTRSEQSREEAQKRLDEDTKKVGYIRGEICQMEDGKWVIHWGGKYPL